MKKILLLHTGGTIGCVLDDGVRALGSDESKSALFNGLSCEIEEIPFYNRTLSENMSMEKLNAIISAISKIGECDGLVVLHGTDTLAYTASLLSTVFCATRFPIMLVSGDRPPNDEKSNAKANLKAALELIQGGIAPNVYVPYRNSDGKMYLHLGSFIMQSPNFSSDFISACKRSIEIDENLHSICDGYSQRRKNDNLNVTLKEDAVLLIHSYVGQNYGRIDLSNVSAVLCDTYHSGTVCVDGEGKHSILSLKRECDARGILLFVAPCDVSGEIYSSTDTLLKNGIIPLNMTLESAYTKLICGVSRGMTGEKLAAFMKTSVNNEII